MPAAILGETQLGAFTLAGDDEDEAAWIGLIEAGYGVTGNVQGTMTYSNHVEAAGSVTGPTGG